MIVTASNARIVTRWLRDGHRVAVGLVVMVAGSSPFDAGAALFIDADGSIAGSVTGGCVESAVTQQAMSLMEHSTAPHRVTYGISDELAGEVGLTCGGTVEVLIHELRSGARDATLQLLASVGVGRACALATVVDGGLAGEQLYADEFTTCASFTGTPQLLQNIARDARGLIRRGGSTLRSYRSDGTLDGSDITVAMTAITDRPRMYVVGAGAYSMAIAEIARQLNFSVTIVDPRAAFLKTLERSGAYDTIGLWPDEVLPEVALTERDAVLVCSHDPKLDVPAVLAALRTPAGYIGALGSRRTAAERRRRLIDAGVDEVDIERFFAPCGLDIGAATPEESAVSVLAEIVAVRSGRPASSLRDQFGPIRGAARTTYLSPT